MTDLAERLDRLGLSGYAKRLALEGFDTWETVLDITESDLNTLGFKLGHRRKLQRAIAESRGQPAERALLLEHGKVTMQDGYQSDESMHDTKESSGQATPAAQASTSQPSTGTKRKYRRHPKADEHAPERPPSAYVIFSNQIREELKGQDLSFTEIAKLVGERWQVLDPGVREAFEKQAASAKEKYYAQMAEYKKTTQYQEYQQYLADFKAKHATPRAEGKRSKLQSESTSESLTTKTTPQEQRRNSLVESAAAGHYRTRSNPNSAGLGYFGSYGPPSASTSPAQASIGLQSPATQHAYSPRSSPPASAPVYGTSYDLPHHTRGTQSVADLRMRDFVGAQPTWHWQPSPVDEGPTQSSVVSDFEARRPSRALGSLPPLVHQDTTHSSQGGDVITPPIPYQAHILPPLDPTKADRTLPQPLPSIGAGLVSAAMDPLRPSNPSTPTVFPHSRMAPSTQTTHFDALLRASELARDADLKDEAARRGGNS